jgi:hypothetical protein
MQIRDLFDLDPGKKIRFRDKHPRSATLLMSAQTVRFSNILENGLKLPAGGKKETSLTLSRQACLAFC